MNESNADSLAHIKSVTSWDSGGGIEVDLVELADGRVLGITDEVVVLYKNMDEATGASDPSEKRPEIYL